MKIAVVDYDIGNVKSILSAFENQGADVFLTRNKQEILKADGLVLPGVGAFSHGMISLESFGLVDVLREYVSLGKPLMGICLGMQMLFEHPQRILHRHVIAGKGHHFGTLLFMQRMQRRMEQRHLSTFSLKPSGAKCTGIP